MLTANFVEKTAYGDVNHDGKIDVVDATLVLKHIVGLVNLAEAYQGAAIIRADVSGNGSIDVGDAILILRRGPYPCLPS